MEEVAGGREPLESSIAPETGAAHRGQGPSMKRKFLQPLMGDDPFSVDHQRADFTRGATPHRVIRAYPPAHAIGGLEEKEVHGGRCEFLGAGEACHPSADDDDIVFFRH
jgi:hypothetical protein